MKRHRPRTIPEGVKTRLSVRTLFDMKALLIGILLTVSISAVGQSATTESLRKKYSDAFTLFFYQNTLRMINQAEDKDLDELIKDIEKMRFLLIKKAEAKFESSDYRSLVQEYKSEQFEEVMTSRHEGKNFDIYVKERNGETKGMLVLVSDADHLYVLDILGRIALEKVTKFFQKLDESSDIGTRIHNFVKEASDGKQKGSSAESQ